jgi:hypothetical protein
MPERKVDKTRNERQARRRAREKLWLSENGFSSWEALHTKLLRKQIGLTKLEHPEDDQA